MAGPIYRMFYSRMTEAWYELPQDAQASLQAEINQNMQKVQGELVLLCDPSWAVEKWSSWGVEKFPSLDALQEYTQCLADLKWFRYCESETMLGSKILGNDCT